MDRCALFVDAGYLLSDGAMAVHGTRHREATSWDYLGLLQLLGNLARERTGLPLLRCYWYDATAEGRAADGHDALDEIPGLKLRVSRIRPGRREGVDAQVHRDLLTLARNNAISDAVVVTADEDLAQVLCDAQDLGVRVTLLQIVGEGDHPVPLALRRECDELIEVGGGHLRPFVAMSADTIVGNGHQPAALPPAITTVPTIPNGQPPLPTVTNLPPPPPPTSRTPGHGALPPPGMAPYPQYTHDTSPPPPSQPPPMGPPPGMPPPGPGGYPQPQPVYAGPQPAPIAPPGPGPGPGPTTTTLAEAVKSAHKEGYDFGESVARDAPPLWLEAVLARKPRMPSDLEARLLQGSALPIDFLLHDEVRHALRRGFWDAFERARR
ncbi:NYN domain-containing protein [Sinosporangium siamense]|uniref:NYN domain-containing protein n=1 Tax=Sinosporangium siamense TaxID=1367973 RepID=A0A919V722_9ACTN|nr:NYN domain-containing protein [Sinosporangium siamense]GII94665.1 hypothetical protein Ssi02_48960 [Sinosporangium siamense]